MTESFGPYRLEELLGRGSMGEVHRAFDTRRERTVALKRLQPDLAGDSEFQERFRRGSRLAAALSSPHVIPIHDFGEIDGQLYIDMRLVAGSDLGALISSNGPLSAAQAAAIMSHLADALDCAHADGLIHRNIKPSNVLITTNRARHFAYLSDFGVERAAADANPSLTRTGTRVGTFAYLAPELFTGAATDKRVDVYALGCVLFEALTGRPPFVGDAAVLMYKHLNETPQVPSETHQGLGSGFDAVVCKAMAKDPAQRYASAGELADAVHQSLGTGTQAALTRVLPAETQVNDHAAAAARHDGSARPPHTRLDHSQPSTPGGVSGDAPGQVRKTRNGLLIPGLVGIVAVLALIGGVWAWQASKDSSSSPAASSVSGAVPSGSGTRTKDGRPLSAMAAQEVVKAIVAKVPSAKASISYTDVTDPNHLLGRPNGYLSKSTFVDNRVPNDNTASSLGDVKVGGSVEVFSDAAGALGRKTYLGNVAKIFSTVVEYDYVSGPVLLRVTPMLTPSEAEEYGAALSSLSGK